MDFRPVEGNEKIDKRKNDLVTAFPLGLLSSQLSTKSHTLAEVLDQRVPTLASVVGMF